MELKTLIPLAIKISIFLTVLAVGLKTNPRNATYMFRQPSELARSLVPMSILMPLFAVVLILLFRHLNPAVEVALVALSLSPVPPLLPGKILKAGGREDYTVGLLAAAALLSIILIPAAMALLDRIFPVSLHMSSAQIVPIVLATVLVPLALGIIVHMFAPRFAGAVAGLIGHIGTILLVLAVIPIFFGSFRDILSLFGDGTFFVMAAFCLLGLAAGHLSGQHESGKQIALAFCTASRHPGIAVAIASVNFPGDKKIPAAILLYLVISGILSTLYLKGTKRLSLGTGERVEGGSGSRLKSA